MGSEGTNGMGSEGTNQLKSSNPTWYKTCQDSNICYYFQGFGFFSRTDVLQGALPFAYQNNSNKTHKPLHLLFLLLTQTSSSGSGPMGNLVSLFLPPANLSPVTHMLQAPGVLEEFLITCHCQGSGLNSLSHLIPLLVSSSHSIIRAPDNEILLLERPGS